MSFLSTVTNFLHSNQPKAPALAGNVSQILKSFWKSPSLSREATASPSYELVESEDIEAYDHLHEVEKADQFDNLKLELLDGDIDNEEDYGDDENDEDYGDFAEATDGIQRNWSFEKLKDLSDSLDEAEARLDLVLKSNRGSSLTLDNLSLDSSIVSESCQSDSDSDFQWSEDDYDYS